MIWRALVLPTQRARIGLGFFLMATKRTYFLYGDSTESNLETNFLEYLRDAIDFSIAALRADTRIKEIRQRVEKLRATSQQETAELEAFVKSVTTAIEVGRGAKGTPTMHCAAH